MDIFDVRLAQVMTGGLNNWGFRSLANGRHTVWESFKSRQEAITAGTLMRSLRGDSSSQGTGADLNATLTHMTKNMFPGQGPYLWDNRYNAIKELTKELAQVVIQKGPVAANQSMMQQIQELQRENARLKSARVQSPAPKTPVHTRTPPPKNSRPPKSAALPKSNATTKSAGVHPTPPSYRRPKDRQNPPEVPDTLVRSLEDCWCARNPDETGADQEQVHEHEPVQEPAGDDATVAPSPDFSPTDWADQDFADPLETVQTFGRTDQAPFLEEFQVDNYKMATINSWVSNRVGKVKMTKDHPGKQISVDRILAAVGDTTGPYNWALLEPERLELHNAGYGGLVEMKEWLAEDLVLFGMIRFTFGRDTVASTMEGMTATPAVVKYIFIHWVGPKVSAVRRGKWNAQQKKADAHVRSVCSITFRREAHSLEELELADLISELLRLAVVDGAVSDSGKSQISVEDYMASLALEQQKQMEAEMEEGRICEGEELGDADAETELPQLDVAVDSVRTAGGDYNWVLLGMQKPPAPTDKAAEDKPSSETKKTQDAAAEAKKAAEGRLAQAATAEKEEQERLASDAVAAEAAATEAKKAEESAAIKAKKAEEERLAKEIAASEAKKAEEERQAKEAAAAAAEAKKAEEERLAKEIAASEAKKAAEERLAKQAEAAAEANRLEEVRMAEEVAAAEAKKAEQERLAKGSAVAAAAVAVAEASKVEEEQLAKDAAAGKEERRAKEAAAIVEATKGQPAQEASVKLDPLKVSSATRSRVSQSDKGYTRRASQPASTMCKDVSAVAVGASVRPEASSMPPKDRRFDQPSSPAPGRAAPRLAGKTKLKSGWGWWWARRHVELRAGKLQWWRKEPQGPPDVELRLSDGITRWVLMRHEGAILELVCESRSGSSSKAMGERVLLRMESDADALEWAKALREELEYVEALLSWPMPLEGRQGDVRYYGIEYPS
eukprot:s1449_g7.t1